MAEPSKAAAALAPAFPIPEGCELPGLSKTEFFAAVAMHSLLMADKGISTDRLVVDSFNIGQAMAVHHESRPRRRTGPNEREGA